MKKPLITITAAVLFIAAMLMLILASCQKVKQCPPTITYDGCDLEVQVHFAYGEFQWLKRDNITGNYLPINGATDWYYEATAGKYKCSTVTLDGCPGTSDRFLVTSWCGHGQ